MIKIFFDLDGTLIDSKQRLYKLFCDLTNQNELDFNQYWTLKRAKTDHRSIMSEYLRSSEDEILLFERKWMRLIESDDYLSLDQPFDFTYNVLKKLTEKHTTIYLITARQNRGGVIKQLKNFKMEDYFKAILVTESLKSKAQLISENVDNLSSNDILVGDTGVDIQTAKQVGIRSFAVLSGFRNESILQNYKPDYLETDIQNILNYV